MYEVEVQSVHCGKCACLRNTFVSHVFTHSGMLHMLSNIVVLLFPKTKLAVVHNPLTEGETLLRPVQRDNKVTAFWEVEQIHLITTQFFTSY